VKPTRRALITGGLWLAGALSLPGCAAERTARAPTGWARIWSPFRVAQQPVAAPETTLGPSAGTLAPPAPPAGNWIPSDSTDNYYSPGNTELAAPLVSPMPQAEPPAAEPGFLDEEADVSTQNTSGGKAQGNRPARLRDVFESFNRKTPTERPKIPLDEPVAARRLPPTTHVVGYEQSEPVVLGRPEFEAD
jgi:hypothetical protein